MIGPVSSASPLVRLGQFTLALGSLCVVRLITEAISEWISFSRIQANIMAIDFLLALGTMASGIGLLRNVRWAPFGTASAASTQFVWYLAWLVLWGPSM